MNVYYNIYIKYIIFQGKEIKKSWMVVGWYFRISKYRKHNFGKQIKINQ